MTPPGEGTEGDVRSERERFQPIVDNQAYPLAPRSAIHELCNTVAALRAEIARLEDTVEIKHNANLGLLDVLKEERTARLTAEEDARVAREGARYGHSALFEDVVRLRERVAAAEGAVTHEVVSLVARRVKDHAGTREVEADLSIARDLVEQARGERRVGEPQGRCDTTMTERFVNPLCRCSTYAGNHGPCMTYEVGGNAFKCVYCDHNAICHIELLTAENAALRARVERLEALVEAGLDATEATEEMLRARVERVEEVETIIRRLRTWFDRSWPEYKKIHPDAAEFLDDEFKRLVNLALAALLPPTPAAPPNNVVACVNCKKPVTVTALNAVRCVECAGGTTGEGT